MKISSSGLFQVISPPAGYYPDFENLYFNTWRSKNVTKFADDFERFKWRSKQNLDYALLMAYAQSRGTYYVQLEDDIIFEPNFLSTMKHSAIERTLK